MCFGNWRDDNNAAAMRAVQKLWVAGTLGAFFTALARNLPIHVQQITWRCDLNYTLDLVLRYGYLLWLLIYFFTSNLLNEKPDAAGRPVRPTWRDVWFDFVQSAAALVAAVCLGFVVTDVRLEWGAYFAANLAILVICAFSLLLFPGRWVDGLRWLGFVLSGISAWLACSLNVGETWVLVFFAVLQLFLWCLLYVYFSRRMQEPP